MSEPMLGQSGSQNRGCMVAALVVLGLVVAYMVYVYFQYKEMPWKFARRMPAMLLEISNRPDDQKKKDLDVFDRFVTAAREGKLREGEKTLEASEALEVVFRLFDPCRSFIGLLSKKGIYEQQIAVSGVSDDEKADAKWLLQLYCVAVRDKMLTDDDRNAWFSSFPKDDELGEDKKLSNEQVRVVVKALKDMLAAKTFPDTIQLFDYERELTRMANGAREMLGEKPEPLPASTQPTVPAKAPTSQPAPATAPTK